MHEQHKSREPWRLSVGLRHLFLAAPCFLFGNCSDKAACGQAGPEPKELRQAGGEFSLGKWPLPMRPVVVAIDEYGTRFTPEVSVNEKGSSIFIANHNIWYVTLADLRPPLGREYLESILELARINSFQGLDLRFWPCLTDKDLQRVANLRQLKVLLISGKWRDLSCEPSVTQLGLDSLRSLEQLSVLEIEDMEELTGHCLANILGGMPNLRECHLSGVELGTVGSCALAGMPNLRRVSIRGGVWYKGKIELGQCLEALFNSKQLAVLDLAHCDGVSDGVLGILSKSQNIQALGLSYVSDISNHGIREVSEMRRLQLLDLQGCRTLDNGCVTDIARCQALQDLLIENSSIQGAADELRGLLPRASVNYQTARAFSEIQASLAERTKR